MARAVSSPGPSSTKPKPRDRSFSLSRITRADATWNPWPLLLTRKKAPPAADRTDLYARMDGFLKLPEGQLSAMAEAQRREELKRQLADPPAPLFKEVRDLVIRKSKTKKRGEIRTIFEKQPFGELERLATQKLLDVTKSIVKDELKNERWLRIVAELLDRSYEKMRANILELLDTDVFNVSPDHCSLFLDPLIGSWDIDLKTFEMEILLNRRLASTRLVRFRFVEVESDESLEEPGFQEFLRRVKSEKNSGRRARTMSRWRGRTDVN